MIHRSFLRRRRSTLFLLFSCNPLNAKTLLATQMIASQRQAFKLMGIVFSRSLSEIGRICPTLTGLPDTLSWVYVIVRKSRLWTGHFRPTLRRLSLWTDCRWFDISERRILERRKHCYFLMSMHQKSLFFCLSRSWVAIAIKAVVIAGKPLPNIDRFGAVTGVSLASVLG